MNNSFTVPTANEWVNQRWHTNVAQYDSVIKMKYMLPGRWNAHTLCKVKETRHRRHTHDSMWIRKEKGRSVETEKRLLGLRVGMRLQTGTRGLFGNVQKIRWFQNSANLLKLSELYTSNGWCKLYFNKTAEIKIKKRKWVEGGVVSIIFFRVGPLAEMQI